MTTSGHGCDLEATHLRDPDRIARLVWGVCVALVWIISVDSWVVKRGGRRLIDCKSRRDKSYFRNDAYHFFSNGISISTSTEHPEEAALWAQYMTSSEVAVQTRLEADWELPTVSDMSLFEDYLAMTPPNNRQAIFDSLEAPVNPPTIERQAEMQAIFDEVFNAVIAGELDPESALNIIKKEIDYLLVE